MAPQMNIWESLRRCWTILGWYNLPQHLIVAHLESPIYKKYLRKNLG